jgi:hypothetical protein
MRVHVAVVTLMALSSESDCRHLHRGRALIRSLRIDAGAPLERLHLIARFSSCSEP